MEIACNNSKQASTEYSPFMLNYGQEINLPIDGMNRRMESGIDRADEWMDKIKNGIEQAKLNIKQAQERQAKYANENRRRPRQQTLSLSLSLSLYSSHSSKVPNKL